MKRKILGLVLILCFLGGIVGCASFQMAKENPYDTWSAKKKLTNAINTYVTEYDKYMAAVIRTDLTEAQKMYLKHKRVALVGLDKVIVLLIPVVDSGGEFPLELEYQLMDWLTQLGFQPM
jgi:hypothetical protein